MYLINLTASADVIRIHVSLLSILRHHQNLHTLVLPPSFPFQRPLLSHLDDFRVLPVFLLSGGGLGDDGKCL